MGALDGKVIAVTGGARGIGEATAKALAAAGAKVAIGDLDAELAESSARSYGGLGLPLDVANLESFAGFLDKVEAEYGRLDGLVNNAGIMVIGRHLETALDKQLRQLDINLRGVINGCHEVAPRLAARGGGEIVNIASIAGRIPTPGTAVYSGTKAGVLAYSEALDAELSSQGVRVSCVLPSFTSTSLIDGTESPKGVKPQPPEKVADAVVRLMTKHRAQAVVPRMLTFSVGQWAGMPSRGRGWLRDKLGMDSTFTEYDVNARSSYEERTSRD